MAAVFPFAARFAWMLPCVAAAVVGLLFQIPGTKLDDQVVLVVMLAAGSAGVVALGAQWLGGAALPARQRFIQIWPGLMANGMVLGLLGAGLVVGERGKEAAQASAANIQASAAVAQKEPGWVGGWQGSAGNLMFIEIPSTSAFAHTIAKDFGTPFHLFIVAGQAAPNGPGLLVDLAQTSLVMGDGTVVPTLDRAAVLATATAGKEAGQTIHGVPYRVPPGKTLGNGMLFLAPGLVSKFLAGLQVTINGVLVRVDGRFLSADEKAQMFR